MVLSIIKRMFAGNDEKGVAIIMCGNRYLMTPIEL